MEKKTNWKSLKNITNPNYIGEADFEPGEEKVVTIKSVNTDVAVVGSEGTKASKTVVYFVEDLKPMIMNVAKSRSITAATGSPNIEDWVGKKITLYIEHNIRAFGEVVSAVRVRKKAPVVRQDKFICEDCGNEIKSAFNMAPSVLAQYTKNKYGKMICADCAKKIAEAKEQDSNNG